VHLNLAKLQLFLVQFELGNLVFNLLCQWHGLFEQRFFLLHVHRECAQRVWILRWEWCVQSIQRETVELRFSAERVVEVFYDGGLSFEISHFASFTFKINGFVDIGRKYFFFIHRSIAYAHCIRRETACWRPSHTMHRGYTLHTPPRKKYTGHRANYKIHGLAHTVHMLCKHAHGVPGISPYKRTKHT